MLAGDVLVGNDGDVTAVFEDSRLHVMGTGASGGAECGIELVDRHSHAVHGFVIDVAIME